MENIIEINNVTFRYSNTDTDSLSDLELCIHKGECILLCGGSGCGKTTVTRLINGLIPHYYEGELTGSITVSGMDTVQSEIEDISVHVGSVFQNPRSQFFCVDTTSEIAFGCENRQMAVQEIEQRVERAVNEIGIADLLGRSIFDLSGGEKQKIACAGVSAASPDIIVLDEPTSNLDLDAIDDLRDILRKWKSEGKTIIIAEHRLAWLNGICDRAVLLENGSVTKEFSAQGFFALSDEQLHKYGLRSVTPLNSFLDLPLGITPITAYDSKGELILRDYRYSYKKHIALNIDTLSIPKGTVTAVVGHNGAGKSTLVKCLCGLQKYFKGTAEYKGKQLRPKDMRRISYMVMQDVNHQLFAESVLDEVMLGMTDENKEQAAAVLEQLDLAELADRHPMSLSGGQKQRTAIASALLAEKEILVFDEPTSGLDYEHMIQTARLIRSLGVKYTVLIITHDPELIRECCTHVLHIEKGKAGEFNSMEEKQKKYDPMQDINNYAGGHKHLITIGRLLAAVSALLTLVPFYDLWKIIKIAIDGNDLDSIKTYAWQAVLLTVGALFVYIAALFCTHIAAFRVQANMRTALMKRIITLPLGVFDEDGTGKIRRTVNDSTAATETYIAHNLPDKAVAAVTPVGLIVLLLIFDWRIGLMCAIPAVIGFMFMMSMMGKDMQKKMAEYQNALDTMSSEATEYVRGIPVVKTFGQTVHSFTRFKSAIDGYGKWATEYTLLLRKPMTGFMTCINAVFAFIVAAAYFFSKDGVTSETLLNVMYYIIMTPLLTVTLTKIAYSGEAEMTLIDAMQRVKAILDIEPLSDSENANKSAGNSVKLSHVSYRYAGAEKDAVHDVSLSVEPGEHIALVGPSGGGKSTTAALIARFFDVAEGDISIGGVNIRDIPQRSLMEQVSFVFQDSKLLKTSILENVRLGKPNATEQEVMAALEQAQCSDILEKLPQGVNTVIGDKGTYLSGGEQQRISIARAILRNAPILILDEATAFADPDNETKVQTAFETLAKDKTLIMIAHRLSTVKNADCIYVLKDGSICEYGTHDKLMEKNGVYCHMFEEYNRSVAWKVGE